MQLAIWRDLQSESIGARLARNGNAGPGFDILRLVLALLIFYGHARGIASIKSDITLSPSSEAVDGNFAMIFVENLRHRLFAIYVPVFFALSGFLVTGSALRLGRAVPFLAFRALRIFPALVVEVTLSALVLGPLVTQYAIPTYFSDPKFASYLLNVFGDVHFALPGVFIDETNQYSGIVNANLWTLPAEFYCYLITTALLVTGIFRRKLLFTGLLAVAIVAMALKFALFSEYRLDRIAALDVVVLYFFLGMAFYLWKDEISLNAKWFVICLIVVAVLFQVPHLAFLMPIPLTYATVYFGCLSFSGIAALRRHDISYGIYLYGFPITQAVLFFIPACRSHALLLTIIAVLVTAVFAALSWHYIEKPALSLKRFFAGRKAKAPALVR